MDHKWDGFYTSQEHKSMFPAVIQTTGFYQIEYTGTPFNNMRYIMKGLNGLIKLRVLYWNAGSYSVSVAGSVVEPNAFDSTIGK